jgi:predicted nuclease of predicted toxin-antitoxin system
MRLLFDQNISFRILRLLPGSFADCQHVRTVGLIDCDDEIIWQYARQNNFTVVTFDADFFKIFIAKGAPPKIVWLRTGNLSNSEIVELLILNFSKIASFINDTGQNCLEIV